LDSSWAKREERSERATHPQDTSPRSFAAKGGPAREVRGRQPPRSAGKLAATPFRGRCGLRPRGKRSWATDAHQAEASERSADRPVLNPARALRTTHHVAPASSRYALGASRGGSSSGTIADVLEAYESSRTAHEKSGLCNEVLVGRIEPGRECRVGVNSPRPKAPAAQLRDAPGNPLRWPLRCRRPRAACAPALVRIELRLAAWPPSYPRWRA
jgi:hypothetical protein